VLAEWEKGKQIMATPATVKTYTNTRMRSAVLYGVMAVVLLGAGIFGISLAKGRSSQLIASHSERKPAVASTPVPGSQSTPSQPQQGSSAPQQSSNSGTTPLPAAPTPKSAPSTGPSSMPSTGPEDNVLLTVVALASLGFTVLSFVRSRFALQQSATRVVSLYK